MLSPILENNRFHPERFEDQIERRGWGNILVENEIKCPCYSSITGSPNYRCSVCGGVGYIYSVDLICEIFDEVASVTAVHTVELKCSVIPNVYDSARTIVAVESIFNVTQNVNLTVTSILHNTIVVSENLGINDVVKVDYIYQRDASVPIKAIMTNVDYKNSFVPQGEWLQGDVIMTVSNIYNWKVRDRITVRDSFLTTTDLLRRGEVDAHNVSREKLMHSKSMIRRVLGCRDKYTNFILDTDYSIGTNGEITWLVNGNSPRHKSFTLRCTKTPSTTTTMTLTSTNLTTKINGATDINITLSSYPTLQSLVDYLNTRTDYTAVISDDAYEIDPGSTLGLVEVAEPTNLLVAVAGVDIKNSAYQVYGQGNCQYTVQYQHYAVYSIFQQVGQVRHPDNHTYPQGSPLPKRYWLRLYEPTKRTAT